MEMKKLLESFNHAINGVVDAVRTQRNMKIHIISSIGVLIACFFLTDISFSCVEIVKATSFISTTF